MRTSSATGTVTLTTGQQGRVATIVIDRGATHHALTVDLLDELEQRIIQVADTTAQVVIMRSAVTRGFHIGTNNAPSSQRPVVDMWRRWTPVGHRVFDQLVRLPQPTIAVVDGLSMGGGAELALACDFRIATNRARVGPSHVGLGTIPGWDGTHRLNQLIGAARTKDVTLSQRRLDVARALTWGLLTSISPAGQVEEQVNQLVDNLLARAPLAQHSEPIDGAATDAPAVTTHALTSGSTPVRNESPSARMP